ncbi:MAG TPA: hypothetical protein VHO02_08450 [Fibrobacteria bacterium]|jgi:uncharacterized repeat protein (TIGR04138 family)|nr:hypothetical protein [Fibrobacteria bacterium]
MTDGWKTAYAAMHRDGATAFPPAAMRYVLDLTRGEAGRTRASLSPAEITAAFRKSARADFGPFLPQVLEHWGLPTPESLGRAVETLARHGCLTLDAGDDTTAFAADSSPLSIPRTEAMA